MNLSPEQKRRVVDTVAEMLVEELRDKMGGTFTSLYVIPLAIAEKMTGLTRNTLRAQLPVVEMSLGKHGVQLSVLQEYIQKRTVFPAADRKRRIA
jgi:hypothetical protein